MRELSEQSFEEHKRVSRRIIIESCMDDVVPGKVFVGNQFAAGHPDSATGMQLSREETQDFLKQHGITHILVTTRIEPLELSYSLAKPDGTISTVVVSHTVVEMSDSSDFELATVLGETYEAIAQVADGNGAILVHCQMGQSRSVAVTVAFVMRHYGLDFNDAFMIVKSRRRLASQERFGPQLIELRWPDDGRDVASLPPELALLLSGNS